MDVSAEVLRGYLDYLRDLGLYDVYRMGDPSDDPALAAWWKFVSATAPASAGLQSAPVSPRSVAAQASSVPTTTQRPSTVARPVSSPVRGGGPEIVIAPPVGVAPAQVRPAAPPPVSSAPPPPTAPCLLVTIVFGT